MSRIKFRFDTAHFGEAHVGQVTGAHIRARKMARRVRDDMEEIWDQRRGWGKWKRRKRAWRRNADFGRWFGDGKLTRAQIRVSRKRIIEVEKRLGKRVTYVLKSGGRLCSGHNAWHAGGLQARRIRICPGFYVSGTPTSTEMDGQASVLVHEIAHGFGQVRIPGTMIHVIPGTGHPKGTDTRAEARDLARDHPRLARRSPENYEQLYEAYGGP